MRNKKITRRGFLGTAAGLGLGSLALPAVSQHSSEDSHERTAQGAGGSGDSAAGRSQRAGDWKSTSHQPPRKVIVGTVMQPLWGKYPGLETRLQQLTEIVDRLQAQSQKQYGRGLDLAVLPETAVSGEAARHVSDSSYPWAGPVQEAFTQKARQHHCYIVAPLYLLEDKATKRCSNAALLIGRQGELAGIYRKVHLVVDRDDDSMEHGCTPGREEPVFSCDFGKLGIQICYDIEFDQGWTELARKGAEIVAWPSQSPQRTRPGARAAEGPYYIVSSTWRTDACVFEPTGRIVSQVEWKPSMGSVDSAGGRSLVGNILVQEIDLSYAILGWSPTLNQGELFTKSFGDRAGFRYYVDDDRGIFWSNDPKMTVRQMIEVLGLTEQKDQLRQAREAYRKAGNRAYRA
ncbi:MAG: carbon-nitrogen hydrolase family protein [Acidobacteriota bacterium]